MTRELQDRKRELYHKSKALREIDTGKLSFEKTREIHKEQDDAYKRWNFINNLENAMRRSNG